MSTKLTIWQLVESSFFPSNCASPLPLRKIAEVCHRKANVQQSDKFEYTDHQAREADDIAAASHPCGLPQMEAESGAWATLNNDDGSGKQTGGPVAQWRFRRPPVRRSRAQRIGPEECRGARGLRGNGRSHTQVSDNQIAGIMT